MSPKQKPAEKNAHYTWGTQRIPKRDPAITTILRVITEQTVNQFHNPFKSIIINKQKQILEKFSIIRIYVAKYIHFMITKKVIVVLRQEKTERICITEKYCKAKYFLSLGLVINISRKNIGHIFGVSH